MNLDELNEVMAEVTYKPGWTLDLGQENWGVVLTMRMTVPDSTTYAHEPVEVVSRSPVDLWWLSRLDRDQFLNWLFHEIMRMERHEAQEWFRFAGELVDDPHASEKIRATER